MKILQVVLVLLLVGTAFAQGAAAQSCLQECCEKYDGTMDSHGCSIQPGDANFNRYTTCSGYCVAGTEPPSTADDGAPSGGVAPTAPSGSASTPYEEPSDGGICGPAAALLLLVGFLAVKQ